MAQVPGGAKGHVHHLSQAIRQHLDSSSKRQVARRVGTRICCSGPGNHYWSSTYKLSLFAGDIFFAEPCAGRGSTSLHLHSFFKSRESKRLFLGKLLNAQYQKGETNQLVKATGSSQFLTPQRNKSICSSVRSVLVHNFKHLSVSESQHTWQESCAGSSSSSPSSSSSYSWIVFFSVQTHHRSNGQAEELTSALPASTSHDLMLAPCWPRRPRRPRSAVEMP